jgi:hypothetical protein
VRLRRDVVAGAVYATLDRLEQKGLIVSRAERRVMTRTPISDTPPRWAEHLLRLLLKPRDRDTIPGDLLEEYREVVLPARGRFRAQLWYLRQALSVVSGVKLGAALGLLFSAWNLLVTVLAPLVEDSPLALLGFYGPMFAMWGVAGFAAYRRSGRLAQAIKVSATVAFITFLIFDIAVIIRLNLFLDVISHRTDWRNLVSSYRSSGFESLRAYANYVYLTGSPFKIFVATVIGAVCGLIGGTLASVSRHRERPLTSR